MDPIGGGWPIGEKNPTLSCFFFSLRARLNDDKWKWEKIYFSQHNRLCHVEPTNRWLLIMPRVEEGQGGLMAKVNNFLKKRNQWKGWFTLTLECNELHQQTNKIKHKDNQSDNKQHKRGLDRNLYMTNLWRCWWKRSFVISTWFQSWYIRGWELGLFAWYFL